MNQTFNEFLIKLFPDIFDDDWYVKIGDLDVKVDSEMKWDTKKEAEDALNKFLKGN